MVYAKPRIHSGEWDSRISLGFCDTSRSPNSGQKTRPRHNLKKKRTCRVVDFTVPADHKWKPDNGKRDKYLDFARELKKLWDIKVIVIPTVNGELGTISKSLEKGPGELEIRGWVETIHSTALLRPARILKSPGDLRSLRLQLKTTSQRWHEKKSHRTIIIMIEFKTRLEWVGKVLHWELCKHLKFDHTKKWYMHYLEHEDDGHISCKWCTWNNLQRLC